MGVQDFTSRLEAFDLENEQLSRRNFDLSPGPSSGCCAGHIAFDIHRPLVQTIDFGNPSGQRFQMPLLEGKQLARNGTDVFFIGGVDAIAPAHGFQNCGAITP